MISVSHLRKHYRVHQRPPGLAAALRSVWTRKFDLVRAVDDISFEIGKGERVGFLGPNGAGKTTTLKVLSGLLVPTEGGVKVSGYEPSQRKPEFLSSIMLVAGQKNQLLWDLPPADTFELNRAIYNVPQADYQARRDEVVTLLDIATVVNKPTRQLSLGERMKCELAAALLHAPKVLFLDEPTIGLDVTMQAAVRRFIRSYGERHGATVLLTSHNMDDVAAICDRVIIIDHGKLIYDGALPDLVRRTRPEKRVTFHLAEPVSKERLEVFGRLISQSDGRATIQIVQADLQRVVTRAFADLPISDLTAEDAPLEEVLADVFAKSAAERAAT